MVWVEGHCARTKSDNMINPHSGSARSYEERRGKERSTHLFLLFIIFLFFVVLVFPVLILFFVVVLIAMSL
jgi:hypothetical protein